MSIGPLSASLDAATLPGLIYILHFQNELFVTAKRDLEQGQIVLTVWDRQGGVIKRHSVDIMSK